MNVLEARRRPEHRRRPPSRLEELVLWHAAREGDRRAADALWLAYERMVIGVARRYLGSGVPLADLVHEGAAGYLRAVEKFDPARGRLSTVIVWWARQAVGRAADGAGLVRVPQRVVAVARGGRGGASDETLRAARFALAPPRSLDAPVAEDGDTTLGETLADPNAVDPELAIMGFSEVS